MLCSRSSGVLRKTLSNVKALRLKSTDGFFHEPMVLPKKEAKTITHTGGVILSSGQKGDLFLNKPNNVKMYQKLFQSGDSSIPVHLRKGKSDDIIYKGSMAFSVVAVTMTLFGIYSTASPKKNS